MYISVPICEPFSVQGKGIEIEYQQAPTPDGRYVDQSVVVFRCSDPNHDLKGSTSLVCVAHEDSGVAHWNGKQPECGTHIHYTRQCKCSHPYAHTLHSNILTEATCATISPNNSNLMVHYEPLAILGPFINERYSVNTIAKFSCDKHHETVYHLVGESTSVCQKNGEWKMMIQPPICGNLKLNRFLALIKFTIFQSLFCAVSTCGTDDLLGTSSNKLLSFLKFEVNGAHFTDISPEGIRYGTGSIGTFTCRDKDMQLVGDAHTTCLANGSWTVPDYLKCGINI